MCEFDKNTGRGIVSLEGDKNMVFVKNVALSFCPECSRVCCRDHTAPETVLLPERREMLKELLRINSGAFFRKKLYPLLMKCAGRKLSLEVLARHIADAMEKSTEGLTPIVAAPLHSYRGDLVRACCINTSSLMVVPVVLALLRSEFLNR